MDENLTRSIFVAVYVAIDLVAIPLLIGLISRTARRAIWLSVLGSLILVLLLEGLVLFLRGARGLPTLQAALFMYGASVIVAPAVGWLTYRIVGFFREATPIAATGRALRFLFVLMIKLALFYVVLNGIWIVGFVDLADEIPQLMFPPGLAQCLYIGAAIAIIFSWIIISARRSRNASVVWLAIVQVIPPAVVLLLLLPMLMAQLQTVWSTPLLDCSPRGIPGYVPDMIDYTRLMLDALGAGALFGLKSTIGWQVATCAPVATSRFASGLVFVLNLVPVLLLALLAYRFHGLCAARREAPSPFKA
jgi:hypothetical protein